MSDEIAMLKEMRDRYWSPEQWRSETWYNPVKNVQRPVRGARLRGPGNRSPGWRFAERADAFSGTIDRTLSAARLLREV